MKIGRNDLCSCGSDVKYKKCCLGKAGNVLTSENVGNDFELFIKTNNSIKLLKVLSLIQLIPKNHSKVVRLETIQNTVCENLTNNDLDVNYVAFQSIIHKQFASDYREDPSESSFTENLIFLNGNNIVFPGISSGSTNVNQILLSTTIIWKNELSEKSKNKIKEGAFLLLHIHNEIAKKLNYERFLYEDDYKGKIHFPTPEFLESNSHLFEFTIEDIQHIYTKFNIQNDIIKEFVSTPEEIKNHNGEETLLIQKPFIIYDDKYYLALPTAQMYSLNLFIRKVISENSELDILNKTYNKFINQEVYKYLVPYWSKIEFDSLLNEDESIWQFDTNKFAYVCYIHEDSNIKTEDRANEVIHNFKKEYKQTDIEFLSLHFFASYKIDEIVPHMFEGITEAKYQLAIDFFDFERINTYWDIDKLSFWKYAKAKNRLDEKDIIIAPFFSILTYYKWYVSNKESFFHSDDAIPNMISFDFSMQGEVIIEADKKNDKHLILYINDEKVLGYIPVYKTEKYAKIYTSEEIFEGSLKVALEKFSFPIWVSCKQQRDYLGKNFIDAILYWLNELHHPLNSLLKPLGKLPVEFILSFDEMLREFMNDGKQMPDNNKINIDFEINPDKRKIELTFPVGIFNALHREDNYGERIIMNSVIKCLNNLLIINGSEEIPEILIKNIIDEYIPLGKKKMILTSNSHDNIQSFDKYIPTVRYIYSADTSIVLEENVKWLNYSTPIPIKINDIEEKIKLCNDLINSLTNQIRNRINEYNSEKLLIHLMLRHESLIQKNGFKDIGLVARLECFSKYDDIIEEYKDFNSKLIKSSHAIRCLIEYVIAEPYYGNKTVNDDDTDFLLALISELIYYGSVKDSIKLGIDNPDMGLLPSGRIGMNHDFYENVLVKYSESVTFDEIHEYRESFDNRFRKEEVKKDGAKQDESLNSYYDKVDIAFQNDIGITLTKIHHILIFLSNHCFVNENSIYSCGELEFMQLLKDNSDLDGNEINAFVKFMSIVTRGKMDVPENESEYPEIYPWRYNREYSYIRRPILKLKAENNSYTILWSARHLDRALENLLAIFHSGLLKVNKEHKEINQLIKDRNNIKGTEFRNKVYEWLSDNTNLKIIKHEVKIRKSVFPNAVRDYGDIDILAFDLENKIIYSIECKNTKQVKIMYDFSSDVQNYLTKQLPKHIARGIWLEENLEQLSIKFDLDLLQFEVKPLVISSYQLPIKFIEKTQIPIYSFNEVKGKKIFNNNQ
ncbi:YecA family protein [Flavobacterium sp. GT3R68]|uniref:YecA family protein n=1 Tax=Flavobacterium sp. GT3R68 TaxID=2594437 RepID=UPI0018F76231|nr:SEC-C domain-containing protein [Flavobacterium sp. GT3R68]